MQRDGVLVVQDCFHAPQVKELLQWTEQLGNAPKGVWVTLGISRGTACANRAVA